VTAGYRRKLHLCRCILAIGSIVSCGPSNPPDESNVVFLVIDAASARHLSCYGGERMTTPNIDALAAEATLFERAYAQASWTWPSVASYMTGRYPPVRGDIAADFLDQPLAVLLHAAGLRTAAFSENPYIIRDFGMAKGFDVFQEYFPYKVLAENMTAYERIESTETVKDTDAWLDENSRDQFFLYVHLLPPHAPYDPPVPYSGRFDPDYRGAIQGRPDILKAIDDGEMQIDARDLAHLVAQYQENLLYADYQVGRLIDSLRSRGLLDKSLLIIASDHGEAFQEHGRMLHNSTVYEEMIHVPLIIRFPPGSANLPPTRSDVVELTDLLPTILDFLQIPPPEGIHGASLLNRRGESEAAGGVARSWTSLMPTLYAGLTTSNRKLIHNLSSGNTELYDLRHDPNERQDLSKQEQDLTRQLMALLQSMEPSASEAREKQMDEKTLRRLRSLGYIR
jgi:arylsulfatase